ncbi:putative FYVE zinc finger, Zinc finger, FYVE/PHD-type, Zinc finger, RING/FYVE/PHD-type [Plasmopara halstedii]
MRQVWPKKPQQANINGYRSLDCGERVTQELREPVRRAHNAPMPNLILDFAATTSASSIPADSVMVMVEEPACVTQTSVQLKKVSTTVTDTSSTDSDNEKSNKFSDENLDKEPQEQETSRSLLTDSLGVDRSSRPHFKEGIRLAEMGKWATLIDRVALEPQLARHKDHHGMLPLHWACTEGDTPPKAVRALLTAFPEAVITKNNAQYLPIHLAVKARAPLETLKLLVDSRPSSLMEDTPGGKTVTQLAKVMQLPQGALEMLQRAEQDYLDLNEDDDEAFDYENVKREIEMQSQLLRESMLHPPSMSGPNASLPASNPISAAFDFCASQNAFENSQNMVTTLSFVDGTLVQSQCSLSRAMSHPCKTEEFMQVKTDTSTSPPTSLALQACDVPASEITRSKSAREIIEASPPAVFDDPTFGRPIYEPDHNAGVCGVCYKKFSMFRKKYQCKGCYTYLCKKHVAGKVMLSDQSKKRSVCGDCYRVYRSGPMSANTPPGSVYTSVQADSTSGSCMSGTGPSFGKMGSNWRSMIPQPVAATISASSTVVEGTETIGANANILFNNRLSTPLRSRGNSVRTARAESTHSMLGRSSNVPGPKLTLRFSTSGAGTRPNRVPSVSRTHCTNPAISDTAVSLTNSDKQASNVCALQHRVASLEECNKLLMSRVSEQEKQYDEAMLLLTTTMTRVAELEMRLPMEQNKSYGGTGGSTTASERASEVDNGEKFSFAMPFMEKYD